MAKYDLIFRMKITNMAFKTGILLSLMYCYNNK